MSKMWIDVGLCNFDPMFFELPYPSVWLKRTWGPVAPNTWSSAGRDPQTQNQQVVPCPEDLKVQTDHSDPTCEILHGPSDHHGTSWNPKTDPFDSGISLPKTSFG